MSWATDIRMELIRIYHISGGSLETRSVDLDMLFVTDPRRRPADRTNLGKAFEDILQGIVYKNDSQVESGMIGRVYIGDPVRWGSLQTWAGPERVHFRVTALE